MPVPPQVVVWAGQQVVSKTVAGMLVGRLAQLGHAHMSATGSALAVASKAAGASTAMAAAAPAASAASTASAVAAGASATAAAAGTTAASISGAAAAAAQSAASFGVSMAGLVRALCVAFAASSSKVGFWRALGAVLRTSGESLGRGLSLALKSKLVSDLRIAWANMDVLHHAIFALGVALSGAMTRVRLRPGRHKRAVDSQGTTAAASSSLPPPTRDNSLVDGRAAVVPKSSATAPVLSPDKSSQERAKTGVPIAAESNSPSIKGAESQVDGSTQASVAHEKVGPMKGAASSADSSSPSKKGTTATQAKGKGSNKRAGHAQPTPKKQDKPKQQRGFFGRAKSFAGRFGHHRGSGGGSRNGGTDFEDGSSSSSSWSSGNARLHVVKLLSSLGIDPDFLPDPNLFGSSLLLMGGDQSVTNAAAMPFLLFAVVVVLALVLLRRRVAATVKQHSNNSSRRSSRSSSPEKRRVTFTPAATEGNADAAAATQGLHLAELKDVWLAAAQRAHEATSSNPDDVDELLWSPPLSGVTPTKAPRPQRALLLGHSPALKKRRPRDDDDDNSVNNKGSKSKSSSVKNGSGGPKKRGSLSSAFAAAIAAPFKASSAAKPARTAPVSSAAAKKKQETLGSAAPSLVAPSVAAINESGASGDSVLSNKTADRLNAATTRVAASAAGVAASGAGTTTDESSSDAEVTYRSPSKAKKNRNQQRQLPPAAPSTPKAELEAAFAAAAAASSASSSAPEANSPNSGSRKAKASDYEVRFNVKLVDLTLEEFGAPQQNAFVSATAHALSVQQSQVVVAGLRAGSVVIDTAIIGLAGHIAPSVGVCAESRLSDGLAHGIAEAGLGACQVSHPVIVPGRAAVPTLSPARSRKPSPVRTPPPQSAAAAAAAARTAEARPAQANAAPTPRTVSPSLASSRAADRFYGSTTPPPVPPPPAQAVSSQEQQQQSTSGNPTSAFVVKPGSAAAAYAAAIQPKASTTEVDSGNIKAPLTRRAANNNASNKSPPRLLSSKTAPFAASSFSTVTGGPATPVGFRPVAQRKGMVANLLRRLSREDSRKSASTSSDGQQEPSTAFSSSSSDLPAGSINDVTATAAPATAANSNDHKINSNQERRFVHSTEGHAFGPVVKVTSDDSTLSESSKDSTNNSLPSLPLNASSTEVGPILPVEDANNRGQAGSNSVVPLRPITPTGPPPEALPASSIATLTAAAAAAAATAATEEPATAAGASSFSMPPPLLVNNNLAATPYGGRPTSSGPYSLDDILESDNEDTRGSSTSHGRASSNGGSKSRSTSRGGGLGDDDNDQSSGAFIGAAAGSVDDSDGSAFGEEQTGEQGTKAAAASSTGASSLQLPPQLTRLTPPDDDNNSVKQGTEALGSKKSTQSMAELKEWEARNSKRLQGLRAPPATLNGDSNFSHEEKDASGYAGV